MGHLKLVRKKEISSFRKLAIGTWQTAYDPTVYGSMTIRMEKALAIHRALSRGARHPPHGHAPRREGRRGRAATLSGRERDPAVEQNLSATGRDDFDPRRANGSRRRQSRSHRGEDRERGKQNSQGHGRRAPSDDRPRAKAQRASRSKRAKGSSSLVPFMFMNVFLKVLSFFMYTLNLQLPGTPRDAFGGATITNVGLARARHGVRAARAVHARSDFHRAWCRRRRARRGRRGWRARSCPAK